MVDTDQEKEALSILSAKSRNHSVEEKRRRKRKKEKRKKEKEKRKWKNEFVLHELTKAVLNAAFYKIACQVLGSSNPVSLLIFGCLWWILNASRNFSIQNSFRQFMQDKFIFPFSFFLFLFPFSFFLFLLLFSSTLWFLDFALRIDRASFSWSMSTILTYGVILWESWHRLFSS